MVAAAATAARPADDVGSRSAARTSLAAGQARERERRGRGRVRRRRHPARPPRPSGDRPRRLPADRVPGERLRQPGPLAVPGRLPVVSTTSSPPTWWPRTRRSYVPYRGPWEIETFVRERLFDLAARRLGMDRFEIRRRNLMSPDERLAGELRRRRPGVGHPGRHAEPGRGAARRAGLGRRHGLGASRGASRRGRAGHVTSSRRPVSPSLLRAMGVVAVTRIAQEARIGLEPDGTLIVYTSQQPHGQGHETTLAQLAADRLGVTPADVRVVWGDTDLVPCNLVGTGGSRAATLASGAVLAGADALHRRLVDLAADVLEIAPARSRSAQRRRRHPRRAEPAACHWSTWPPPGRAARASLIEARGRVPVRERHMVAGHPLLSGRGRRGDRRGSTC